MALNIGANDYITKPIDFDRFTETIKTLLSPQTYLTDGKIYKERREPLRKEVILPIIGRIEKKLVYGTSVDLSINGMKVKLNRFVQRGTIFTLQFKLKTDNLDITVKTESLVRWSNMVGALGECEAGIKFINLGQEYSVAILEYLNSIRTE